MNNDFWKKSWNELQPISENLKFDLAEYWLRNHSFTDGKRYPSNEKDYQKIVSMQTEIISTFVKDNTLLLIMPVWEQSSGEPVIDDDSLIKRCGLSYWDTFDEDLEEEDPEFKMYRHLYLGELNMRNKEFDEILRQIADDKLGGVIFGSPEFKDLFAPYDGGFDVFLRDEKDRKILIKEFGFSKTL